MNWWILKVEEEVVGGRDVRRGFIWGEVMMGWSLHCSLFIIILVAESVCVDVAVEELR